MLLKSNYVAYLGILLGLNQILIILSSIIETNTILFFSFAALIIGVVIVEFGVKKGALFYISSSILGFFLTYNKIEIISYIIFFGTYSIIKYIIEKRSYSFIIEIIIKILYFNIALTIMYFLVNMFITIKLLWWMIVAGEILFIIYDYAFTIFINYYINNIRPKLKISNKNK